MKLRHVTRTVGISAAVASVGALSSLAFAGTAGAASPGSGAQVAATVAQSPYTPGLPFDSGQTITVTAPANTIFSPTENVEIAECAAPFGVLPTLSSSCDTNSLDADTIFPNPDGSVDYTNYTVYKLPNAFSLGETPTTTPVCGNTPATECVLYIGNDVEDFTTPHFFTNTFYVVADPTDSGTVNPGDGTPEVPLAIGLPLAAAGIMGGLVYRRRRSARAAA
jgi:hypothetical protein